MTHRDRPYRPRQPHYYPFPRRHGLCRRQCRIRPRGGADAEAHRPRASGDQGSDTGFRAYGQFAHFNGPVPVKLGFIIGPRRQRRSFPDHPGRRLAIENHRPGICRQPPDGQKRHTGKPVPEPARRNLNRDYVFPRLIRVLPPSGFPFRLGFVATSRRYAWPRRCRASGWKIPIRCRTSLGPARNFRRRSGFAWRRRWTTPDYG